MKTKDKTKKSKKISNKEKWDGIFRTGKKGKLNPKKKNPKKMKGAASVAMRNAWRRMLTNNYGFSRGQLSRMLSDDEQYDINKECGYPEVVTPQMCRQFIVRDGIADRCNSVFAKECWSVEPTVYETEDVPAKAQTKFEKAWNKLYVNLKLNEKMSRADEVSGIGHYGVMVLGFGDKDMSKPVAKYTNKGVMKAVGGPYKLLWVMPLDEIQADIGAFDQDPRTPHFGQPMYYTLRLADPNAPKMTNLGVNTRVHWSRVIHIPDNCKTGDIYGSPRLRIVFNYLLNIRKILGGSAEGIWKGGFPGISFEIPPELAGEVEWDKESLEEEMIKYFSGQKRYIAAEGLHANSLMPNIADATPALTIQLQAICISLGIPMRVFIGTEEARLASIQDAESWNKRVHKRQNDQVSARIIRPLVDRLIVCGVLPTPTKMDGDYKVYWPDLYSVSNADKAQIAVQFVAAMAQYQESACSQLMPPQEFLVRVLNYTVDEAESIMDAAATEKAKQVKLGAIDKAGRPLPSAADMQIAKAQMQIKLKTAGGRPSAKGNLKQKTGVTQRSRAQTTSQRAKNTGKKKAA